MLIIRSVIFTIVFLTYPNVPTEKNQFSMYDWGNGTFVYAHDYLAGGILNELQVGEVIILDGRYYLLSGVTIHWMDEGTRVWVEKVGRYSSADTLTFITCHPEEGRDGRLILQFSPISKEEHMSLLFASTRTRKEKELETLYAQLELATDPRAIDRLTRSIEAVEKYLAAHPVSHSDLVVDNDQLITVPDEDE